MAYPTSVNDQITDSVTQTAPKKSEKKKSRNSESSSGQPGDAGKKDHRGEPPSESA